VSENIHELNLLQPITATLGKHVFSRRSDVSCRVCVDRHVDCVMPKGSKRHFNIFTGDKNVILCNCPYHYFSANNS